MLVGFKIVAAIEYCVSAEVRQAQKEYESRLDAALEEIGRLGSVQSSMALKLTMRQIRTLRQADRDENALAIFRTNFPDVANKSDEEVHLLIAELNNIERKAGRAEVMKTKIIKSNIHTVLKPLDKEWNTRFGVGLMQTSPSIIQERANDLLKVRVENQKQFDVWQGKVFELFVDALVFRGYAGRERKPVGTVDPGQLRLYRRNWSEWCERNSLRVLESASRTSVEELTKDRTRSYNINAELRRQARLQQSIMEKVRREYEALEKQLETVDLPSKPSDPKSADLPPSASPYKVVLRQKGENELEAERSWASRDLLTVQLLNWLDSITKAWGEDPQNCLMTLYCQNKSGTFKVDLLASSLQEASDKILGVVSSNPEDPGTRSPNELLDEDWFPVRGGSRRSA